MEPPADKPKRIPPKCKNPRNPSVIAGGVGSRCDYHGGEGCATGKRKCLFCEKQDNPAAPPGAAGPPAAEPAAQPAAKRQRVEIHAEVSSDEEPEADRLDNDDLSQLPGLSAAQKAARQRVLQEETDAFNKMAFEVQLRAKMRAEVVKEELSTFTESIAEAGRRLGAAQEQLRLQKEAAAAAEQELERVRGEAEQASSKQQEQAKELERSLAEAKQVSTQQQEQGKELERLRVEVEQATTKQQEQGQELERLRAEAEQASTKEQQQAKELERLRDEAKQARQMEENESVLRGRAEDAVKQQAKELQQASMMLQELGKELERLRSEAEQARACSHTHLHSSLLFSPLICHTCHAVTPSRRHAHHSRRRARIDRIACSCGLTAAGRAVKIGRL